MPVINTQATQTATHWAGDVGKPQRPGRPEAGAFVTPVAELVTGLPSFVTSRPHASIVAAILGIGRGASAASQTAGEAA
jgi:hypothetical protein